LDTNSLAAMILIGHRENFLLTDCTGADLIANGVARPIALIHAPIIGAQISVTEMFALRQTQSKIPV
jgi:hypothetical protein